eukprot:1159886-Pelagomonas_calceolata.AAC.2
MEEVHAYCSKRALLNNLPRLQKVQVPLLGRLAHTPGTTTMSTFGGPLGPMVLTFSELCVVLLASCTLVGPANSEQDPDRPAAQLPRPCLSTQALIEYPEGHDQCRGCAGPV